MDDLTILKQRLFELEERQKDQQMQLEAVMNILKGTLMLFDHTACGFNNDFLVDWKMFSTIQNDLKERLDDLMNADED